MLRKGTYFRKKEIFPISETISYFMKRFLFPKTFPISETFPKIGNVFGNRKRFLK